jgi:uncharacterized membrane protein YhaH (DUF805 family)
MKVRVRRWYWGVLLIWLGTGLPIYVIGEGFAGPENGAFTLTAFLRSLAPPSGGVDIITPWAIGTALILLPILALPAAIRITRRPAMNNSE